MLYFSGSVKQKYNREDEEKGIMRNTLHKKMAGIKALLLAVILLWATLVPQFAVQAAPNEVPQAALGIDVSRYQGVIDWNQVAASGVQFAMIRIGYRTQSTGILKKCRSLIMTFSYGLDTGTRFRTENSPRRSFNGETDTTSTTLGSEVYSITSNTIASPA